MALNHETEYEIRRCLLIRLLQGTLLSHRQHPVFSCCAVGIAAYRSVSAFSQWLRWFSPI